MARDRYRILDPIAPHFLTCTAVQWLPIFAQPANAQILLDSLQYLQEQCRLTLYGYVILENPHLHPPDRRRSTATAACPRRRSA